MERRTEQGFKPTKQTMAKLRPDPLRRLLLNNRINEILYSVALEIREVYEYITQPVEMVTLDYTRLDLPMGSRAASPTSENEPVEMRRLQKRYHEWQDNLHYKGWRAQPVIDLVVNGIPPRDEPTERMIIGALKIF